MSAISTIVPIREITTDINRDTRNNHHPSSYDQSDHTLASTNLSSAGTLSFRDLTYTLHGTRTDDRRRKCCPSCLKPPTPKQILHKVSGIFSSGMNAILGPSGSGKSSLLNVLAGRKDTQDLSGEIFMDGFPLSSSYKYMVGYVVQDDIISGTLTVRENLMFSANIRLSSNISWNERKERVERVIQELGLVSCANTKIGTLFLRGISGGERKRTCIGMELVLEPKILFLDEPTTGLDASTARNVMQCLSRLSKGGRTIIFSIHQPRYSIFRLFNTVLLMCNGKSVYHGSSKEILSYFSEQGYQCELHDNPADFVLDVLIDVSQDENDLEKLYISYKKSSMYTITMNNINQQLHRNDVVISEKKFVMKRSLSREICYLSIRTLINVIRNPELFMSQIVIAIILSLLAGLVFYDMKKTIDPGIPNRFGGIFFIVVSQTFSAVTSLEPLLNDRVLFIHENVSGYYRVSTFFLTKFLCDVLPMRIISSIIYSLIAYFLTGLQISVKQFCIFLLTIFITSMFGSGLCFFIAATIPLFAVALIIVVLIFIILMIFGGFMVDLSSVFDWLSWIQWISPFRYASNMLTINEFRNITFCLLNMTNVCPMTGKDVLEQKKIDYKTDWDMWKNFFAITIMTLAFFILAFIQLLRMKKTK